MQKITFNIYINAPREHVWQILWGDDTYPKWTSVFSEGSKAVTDWQEGSKVRFLDGKGSGMFSEIARRIDHEFMSFRHLGEIKNGIEQPIDEKTKQWSGGLENYTLHEKDGGTDLSAELDAPEEFLGYFNETFPKAMDQIKKLSENA